MSPLGFAGCSACDRAGCLDDGEGLMVTSATTTLPGSMNDSVRESSRKGGEAGRRAPSRGQHVRPEAAARQPSAGGGAEPEHYSKRSGDYALRTSGYAIKI